MSLRSDINELKRRVCTIENCGNSITQETDPIFINSPAFGITNQNITDWTSASGLVGNVVTTSGNQTGLAGTKAWTALHTFGAGLDTIGIGRGSISAPLDIRQTGSANILLRFQGTTGNVYIQAPGTAPTDNGYRLTVAGTGLFTDTVSFTGSWANGQLNVGKISDAGRITFNNGANGGANFEVGYASAAAITPRVLSTSSTGLTITTAHSSGGLTVITGGSTTRLTIENTGRATFTDDVVLSTVGKSFVLRSPDGTYYKITVANGGAISSQPFTI